MLIFRQKSFLKTQQPVLPYYVVMRIKNQLLWNLILRDFQTFLTLETEKIIDLEDIVCISNQISIHCIGIYFS